MEIKWNDRLSMNIKEIDAQHKEIIKRIALFGPAISRGEKKEIVKNTLNYIQRYVIKHFNMEERAMDLYNYPYSEAHKKQHQSFKNLLRAKNKEYLEKGEQATLTFCINIRDMLFKWFVNHIMSSDRHFSDFLRENNSDKDFDFVLE